MDEEIYDEIEQLIHGSKPDVNVCELPDAFYRVKSKNDLIKLIHYSVEFYGTECNLNWIDVSEITNMNRLFKYDIYDLLNLNAGLFNGDISRWDVSHVEDMTYMFKCSKFNGNISDWDVHNVFYMDGMFEFGCFDQDISDWDISDVFMMNSMFRRSPYSQESIIKWKDKMGKMCKTKDMFKDCPLQKF
jgi:hypothetical protein